MLGNEVQRIARNNATAGTFVLQFYNGVFGLATLPWNATADQVREGLEAMETILPGDVIVSGGPLDSAAVDVEFAGRYVGANVAPMTVDNTGLVGGTMVITTILQGESTLPALGTEVINSIPVPRPPAYVDFDVVPHSDSHVVINTSFGSYIYNDPPIFYHEIGTELTFTATLRDTPLPYNIVEYLWDFGDGSRGSGNPVTHTYKVANPNVVAHVRAMNEDGTLSYASKTMMLVPIPPDITPPETTITSGVAEGATIEVFTTAAATATFEFTATEAGSFQGRLDGGVWTTITSPYTTPTLTDGSHTFEVRGIDSSGNPDATPASRTFTVNIFQPADISGLQLWLKADSLNLANAAAVTSWTDSSGFSRHAAQADAARQPSFRTNVINGKPVVRFDGFSDTLIVPNHALPYVTVIAVVKLASSASDYRHILSLPAGTGWGSPYARTRLLNEGSQFAFDVQQSGTSVNQVVAGAIDTNWHVYSGTWDGTFVRNFMEGVLKQEKDASHSGAITASAEPIAIGGRSTTSYGEYWNGDMAEVIVYNAALSNADRLRVERYLSAKYGLTLAV